MADFFVHESSYIDNSVEIGENTKIWHFCHIQSGAKIGKNCSLGQNVNISNNVIIGNDVKIQNNVSVYEGVEIEDGVFCGPSCVFTNDLTPRARYPKGHENYKHTLIKEGASIGANATIICGNTVGKVCYDSSRRSGDKRYTRLCTGSRRSGTGGWNCRQAGKYSLCMIFKII